MILYPNMFRNIWIYVRTKCQYFKNSDAAADDDDDYRYYYYLSSVRSDIY